MEKKIQRYAVTAILWSWVSMLDFYFEWYYLAVPALAISGIYLYRLFLFKAEK